MILILATIDCCSAARRMMVLVPVLLVQTQQDCRRMDMFMKDSGFPGLIHEK